MDSINKGYNLLKSKEGSNISIIGNVSDQPWQHLMGFYTDYPFAEYFDLEDGFQTVIYTKLEIVKERKIEVTGRVIKVEGRPKRARKDSEERYVEFHILVDSFVEIFIK